MDQEATIAENVIKRGYGRRKDGTPWTPDELAARQALKSLSESVEAVLCVKWPKSGNITIMLEAARAAKEMADFVFDQTWRDCIGATIPDKKAFVDECADVVIPMCVAAYVLGIYLGNWAEKKSEGDIDRGVR